LRSGGDRIMRVRADFTGTSGVVATLQWGLSVDGSVRFDDIGLSAPRVRQAHRLIGVTSPTSNCIASL
jgi:hypothetical protein